MTLEERVKTQLADMVWQLLVLSAAIDEKEKEIADLKKELEKANTASADD